MVMLDPVEATRSIQVLTAEAPTSLTITAPNTVNQGENFNTAGILLRTDTNTPVPGVMITVSYNGTTLGNVFTDDLGRYLLSASIDVPGTFTLKAVFAGAEVSGLTLKSSEATRGIGTALTTSPLVPIAIIAGILLVLSRK